MSYERIKNKIIIGAIKDAAVILLCVFAVLIIASKI